MLTGLAGKSSRMIKDKLMSNKESNILTELHDEYVNTPMTPNQVERVDRKWLSLIAKIDKQREKLKQLEEGYYKLNEDMVRAHGAQVMVIEGEEFHPSYMTKNGKVRVHILRSRRKK